MDHPPQPSRRQFLVQAAAAGSGALLLAGAELRAAEAPPTPPPDDPTLADILVAQLIAWQVSLVFGMIGDGINPIIEALRKRQDQIRFISVRHEESAAFMASGYAKYTGKLGVCIGTCGPVAIHLMNGLYDASKENAPVLAITGASFHDLQGTYYSQEINTISLMEDVAVYNHSLTGPRQTRAIVDLACRTALGTPGVAHLTVAKDTQLVPLSQDKASKGSENLRSSPTYTPRVEIPPAPEMDAVAEVLNRGQRVMILAGRGALPAGDEVEQLAGKLGPPVAKALLGKAVLPDDSPYTTGGTGHLGTLPSMEGLHQCDTLLILGSNMPWLAFYPKPDQARIVQIERDPKRVGLRCPVEIGLIGDVRATLQALLPRLQRKTERGFLRLAQQGMTDWRKALARVEDEDNPLIKPQYLAAQVSRLLNDDATVSIDTGAHTVFTARHWQLRRGQQLAVSGNLATMAPGLPYAIAAQLAYPGRQCVAMVGDGGFTMLMGDLATAVRHQLPIKVVIFRNNSLSQDLYEQKELGSQPFGADLTPIDFVKVAEACGAEGYRCTRKEEVAATLQKAFASTRPAVVEAWVDPDQAPAAPDKILLNEW